MSITFSLNNKVVIVTGAGRGIGKAIAIEAARAGADLAIGSRTVSELESAAQEVRSLGRRCEFFELDVISTASIDNFVNNVGNVYERIDILVNNAGFNKIKPALEVTEEEFDYIVDANLKNVFFMSCAVARHMIRKGIKGRIINISSQVGVVGGPLRAPYSGAKGGVTTLTKSLAAEWAPHGITVNAVAPTVTRTPLAEKAMQNPDFKSNVLRNILLSRLAEPNEIAAAVIYLASDAASIVTGHTLVVDGGWTAV